MNYLDLYSTPIWQLTGEQLVNLLTSAFTAKDNRQESTKVTDVSQGDKYAYGIKGICEIFGCSKPTAQRIKSSGVIDAAITQVDRTIVIDREKALELAKNRKKGGRK
jgi:hypothetical protein